MMAKCYPCEVRIVHVFHDNGQTADPIMCEDIGGGWGEMKLIGQREKLCSMGFCLCSTAEVWREQHDGTRKLPNRTAG